MPTYQLPLRPHFPENTVDPRMAMGPPQKRNIGANFDIISSMPKRRETSFNATSRAAKSITKPDNSYVDLDTEFQPVGFQDNLSPHEDIPEDPSYFEEAYEAILRARATIDSVEFDFLTQEMDELWT